ncbi:MAG: acyltransferase [Pseudobutyrivibrio sp.]|uniref:acyltransferase family protein n=1 Tax=Pseudobutyrivibrio sp. TaxID=2014367 RepID=UPI0025FC4DAA|nr:acyltransferase [Pseudobutyrivibrio sp.]MBQ6462069.1 acyltransferase [Pseudobutyrivibrio sp.]
MDSKARNNNIDIIKGIAIILMVYGHTFGVARDFIYLFHMPVFIFVSGYCFNKAHGASLQQAEGYFFSRVRRLLIPYMGFNIVYAILNNVFISLNFYTDNGAFKQDVVFIQKAAQTLMHRKGVRELVVDVYNVLTLKEIPQMGSASWFLIVLFLVCVIHCFVEYGIRGLGSKVRVAVLCVLLAINLLVAFAISKGFASEAPIADRHLQVFGVYSCYLMGVLTRSFVDTGMLGKLLAKKWIVVCAGPVSFGGLLSLLPFGTLELSKSQIVNPVFLVATTLLGIAMLASVAVDFENNFLGRWLTFIGKYTMSILFLHILAFKLVSVGYCLAVGKPMYMVASWPVIFDAPEYVLIIYTIVGVALPLLADAVIDRLKAIYKRQILTDSNSGD